MILWGNLSYQTTDDKLCAACSAFGEVTSVKVIKDLHTGRSKGFSLVKMADKAQRKRPLTSLITRTWMATIAMLTKHAPRPMIAAVTSVHVVRAGDSYIDKPVSEFA